MIKKILSGFLFSFVAFSILGQTNFILDQKVPRAGEFSENSQLLHKNNNNPVLDGEAGYDSLNMSFQGNWPFGSGNNIISTITGDTVFIASGGGVMIMDITNPESPELISEVRARAFVDHLYFDSETRQLYLAAYFSGFEIWDLSDILNPSRLSRTPTEGLPRGGIYAYGGYLYIITVVDGMLIYDISDPVNPVYVTTTGINGQAWNYFATNHFIYIRTLSPNAIRLYDLTEPASPVLRDSYTSGSPFAIYVKDGLGYISDSNLGLVIIDVSDPDNFTFVSSLEIPGSCRDAIVIDGFAYVANNWFGNDEGGVYAIDVSDPETPVQVDHFVSYYVAITGNNNVLSCIGGDGYDLFELPGAGQLGFIGKTGLPGFLTDVAVKGDYAYTGSNGIRVFDIADKSSPQEVAFVESEAMLVDISGDIAVFIPESMGGGNRLSVMDITVPENIYEMGHRSGMLLTQEAKIHGDYVYVAGWWDGITVLDISDPTSPVFVKKVHNWIDDNSIPGVEWCFVSDLDVQGDYLYVIDYKPFEDDDTKGLYIFDISDPGNPELITRYEQQSQQSWRIKVKDNYVYLADAFGGIEIIDVIDKLAPQTIAYQELMDVAYNLDVSFGYVYASCYILGGVQAVRITEPANPAVEGYYYKSGLFALNVTSNGPDIYIADGSDGFQIYDHEVLTTALDNPIQVSNEIGVFPNPSDGLINLDVNNATEVVVFDQTGRFLKKEQLKDDKHVIDLSALPDGIYFLKFKLKDRIQLQKIVISR